MDALLLQAARERAHAYGSVPSLSGGQHALKEPQPHAAIAITNQDDQ